MIRTMQYGFSLTVLALCLLGIRTAVDAAAKDLEERKRRFEQVLTQVASAIAKTTKRQIVAVDVVSAKGDAEASVGTLRSLKAALSQALLAQSVLAFTLDSRDNLEVDGDKGGYTKAVLLSKRNIGILKEQRHAHYIALVELRKGRREIRSTIELFDLLKKKRVYGSKLPGFEPAGANALSKVELLPRMNVVVLNHAVRNYGEQVDTGECWDLPASALRKAGIRVRDYDFGKQVPWEGALPGDILTIDNGKYQHVMVLLKREKNIRDARILHQNWNQKRYVMEDRFPAAYAEGIVIWRPGIGD